MVEMWNDDSSTVVLELKLLVGSSASSHQVQPVRTFLAMTQHLAEKKCILFNKPRQNLHQESAGNNNASVNTQIVDICNWVFIGADHLCFLVTPNVLNETGHDRALSIYTSIKSDLYLTI